MSKSMSTGQSYTPNSPTQTSEAVSPRPSSPTPSLQFLLDICDYSPPPSPPPHTRFSVDDVKLSAVPPKDARQWCLDEVSLFEAQIRSLRTRANSFTDINKLPDDILSDIFNLVVEDDHQSDRQLYMNLRLSAVCQRWRSVALDSQLLWTVVDLSHLSRAAAFLARSGTASVDAYLDNGFYGQGGGDTSRVDGWTLWATLSPHAHHISALYIEVPYNHMVELLDSLDCTFTNLVNLRLLCPIEKMEPRDGIQTVFYNPSGAHTIQELDLYKVFVPWVSPAYDNLRDLDLRYQVSNPSLAPTMDGFLSVLERSPELEYLRLAFAGPMLDPSDITYPKPQRKIELKRLKSVTLYNNPLDIGHLLAHLDFPATTTLNLHAILSPSNSICDLFPRYGRLSAFDDISHLHLSYTKSYTECAWDENDLSLHLEATSKESPHSRINVDFKWSDDGGNDAWAIGIPQTFRSLPVLFAHSPITHIEVTCSYHAFMPSDWRLVLSSFPTLTSLTAQPLSPAYYVPSSSVEDLLEVLTPSLSRNVESDAEIICPQLRRLKLGSFTMGNAFCGTAMDCVSARRSRDVGLCWVGLGHFNWVGEDEFVMPVWGECVGCRCGEVKVCGDPAKEWVESEAEV